MPETYKFSEESPEVQWYKDFISNFINRHHEYIEELIKQGDADSNLHKDWTFFVEGTLDGAFDSLSPNDLQNAPPSLRNLLPRGEPKGEPTENEALWEALDKYMEPWIKKAFDKSVITREVEQETGPLGPVSLYEQYLLTGDYDKARELYNKMDRETQELAVERAQKTFAKSLKGLTKLAFNDMIGKGWDSAKQYSFCIQESAGGNPQFWWVPQVLRRFPHPPEYDAVVRNPDGSYKSFPKGKSGKGAAMNLQIIRLANILHKRGFKEEARQIIRAAEEEWEGTWKQDVPEGHYLYDSMEDVIVGPMSEQQASQAWDYLASEHELKTDEDAAEFLSVHTAAEVEEMYKEGLEAALVSYESFIKIPESLPEEQEELLSPEELEEWFKKSSQKLKKLAILLHKKGFKKESRKLMGLVKND